MRLMRLTDKAHRNAQSSIPDAMHRRHAQDLDTYASAASCMIDEERRSSLFMSETDAATSPTEFREHSGHVLINSCGVVVVIL
jgi:hypothetical protein